jgi:hypothetical protein
MSEFSASDSGEWETVDSTNKKKGKKGASAEAMLAELTAIPMELDLNKPSLRSPEISLQPENKRLVGQYLVSSKRGILKGSDGKIRRSPPPQFFKDLPGPTKIVPTAGSDNPLDQFGDFSMRLARDGLFEPDTILPTVHFMIGRGCLKKIMKMFDPVRGSTHGSPLNSLPFKFRIKKQDQFLMIEETEKWQSGNVAYGFAFESLMTVCPEKQLKDYYFYRNICYELDGLTLLVGFEVDCCFNNPPGYSSIELKTHNVRYEPDWLDYWETLVLSDTELLCVTVQSVM